MHSSCSQSALCCAHRAPCTCPDQGALNSSITGLGIRVLNLAASCTVSAHRAEPVAQRHCGQAQAGQVEGGAAAVAAQQLAGAPAHAALVVVALLRLKCTGAWRTDTLWSLQGGIVHFARPAKPFGQLKHTMTILAAFRICASSGAHAILQQLCCCVTSYTCARRLQGEERQGQGAPWLSSRKESSRS